MARADSVLRAAQSVTQEPLPPARGIAEGNADMVLVLLAALFRKRHGLERVAAALAGHVSQFAQWLEEYDVQVLLQSVDCTLSSARVYLECGKSHACEPHAHLQCAWVFSSLVTASEVQACWGMTAAAALKGRMLKEGTLRAGLAGGAHVQGVAAEPAAERGAHPEPDGVAARRLRAAACAGHDCRRLRFLALRAQTPLQAPSQAAQVHRELQPGWPLAIENSSKMPTFR